MYGVVQFSENLGVAKKNLISKEIFLSRPASTEAPGMPPVGGVPMGMPMGAPVVQGRGATSSQSFGEMIYPGISWWFNGGLMFFW